MKEKQIGETIEWYYGFAWRNYNRGTAIYVIIPFNFVASFIRHIWIKSSRGIDTLDKELNTEYKRGYEDGKSDGYKEFGREMAEILKEVKPQLTYEPNMPRMQVSLHPRV